MDSPTPRLVVGLGNPGREYAATRHNVGFMVLERLRQSLPGATAQEPRHHADSLVWTCRCAGQPVILQQPLTFMNESGVAVAKLSRELAVTPPEILVVYDELDLPLGRLRLRTQGSSGGHHGVESLIAHLGSQQFRRLRVGIRGAAEIGDTVAYVLGPFAPAEQLVLGRVVPAAAETVLLAIRRGVTVAMNHSNHLDFAEPAGPAVTAKTEDPVP